MSFDSQFHPKYLFDCQFMLIQLKKKTIGLSNTFSSDLYSVSIGFLEGYRFSGK